MEKYEMAPVMITTVAIWWKRRVPRGVWKAWFVRRLETWTATIETYYESPPDDCEERNREKGEDCPQPVGAMVRYMKLGLGRVRVYRTHREVKYNYEMRDVKAIKMR